jgi:hypothetical protein
MCGDNTASLQLHGALMAVRLATGAGGVPGCGAAEQRFDLVLRDGTIVTPGHEDQADVGVAGGRIAEFGGATTGRGPGIQGSA